MEVSKLSLIKRAIRHLHPTHIIRNFLTKHTMKKLADKYGLVYFGYVSQKADDHKMIRGHTVSTTQIDNHYCLGTVQSYDVSLVHRNDLVRTFKGHDRRCHWLIATIDLKTERELPHFYVGPQADNELFEASYTQLHPIHMGNTAQYSHKFTSNYFVYAQPEDAIDIEWLLHPAVADVVVSYFENMPFEVENNVLCVYNENQHPGAAQIDKMLENGIWLAKQIDAVTNADIGRE